MKKRAKNKSWNNLIASPSTPLEVRLRTLLDSWRRRSAWHRGFNHHEAHEAKADAIATCYEELAIQLGVFLQSEEARKMTAAEWSQSMASFIVRQKVASLVAGASASRDVLPEHRERAVRIVAIVLSNIPPSLRK